MTSSSSAFMVPAPSPSSLNASTASILSNSPGRLPPPHKSMYAWIMVISIHIKPIQLYPHFTSYHPYSIKCSIPFFLTKQGQRICSHPYDLHTYTRGYPPSLINKSPMPTILMPSGLPNPPIAQYFVNFFSNYTFSTAH